MAADVATVPQATHVNPLSVAALVAAVAGPVVGVPLWFARPMYGGVVVLLGFALALGFGFSARGQIEMSSGRETGRQLADAAIVIGLVEVGALVLTALVLITVNAVLAGVIVTGLTVAVLLALILGNARLVARYLLLTLLAAVVLFPIYITLVNSLLTPEQISRRPPSMFPFDPQWDTYSEAWSAGHMATYLRNSFIVTILITVGQIVTAVLAGYAFAFLQFPLKRTLFVVFLSTLMVPFEVTIITNLQTVDSLGWLNSYQGLAVPFLATGFGAFLLRQAFLQVPRDLQDAAAMDGYGHLRFMVRVAVPLARPAIAALAVFGFLSAWNQYLWPLLVTDDDQYRTVQIGLKQLRGTQLDEINVTFAGVIIAAVPLLILLVFFQKQLVRGLTAGAVKG
ncbi:MAG TPA: carbohydrate ABC transporter permease [Acidimicrobiia bacterium]